MTVCLHYIVTIHMAGHMYRQTRHGTRPSLGLGLEFAHDACASLLTFLHTRPAVCITSAVCTIMQSL